MLRKSATRQRRPLAISLYDSRSSTRNATSAACMGGTGQDPPPRTDRRCGAVGLIIFFGSSSTLTFPLEKVRFE